MIVLMVLWPTLMCGVSEPSPVKVVTYENLMKEWTVLWGTNNVSEYGRIIFDYPAIMKLGKEYDAMIYPTPQYGIDPIPMKWIMIGMKNPVLRIYKLDGTFGFSIGYIYGATILMEGQGGILTGGTMTYENVHLNCATCISMAD